MFQYEARVKRIIDGDTMVLDLDLGFKVHVEETIRLAHLNAPDVVNYGAEGIVDPARDFIAQRTPPGMVVIATIYKAEKYGRWLADILFQPGVAERDEILKSPRSLNDEMIKAGVAVPYEGGRK